MPQPPTLHSRTKQGCSGGQAVEAIEHRGIMIIKTNGELIFINAALRSLTSSAHSGLDSNFSYR